MQDKRILVVGYGKLGQRISDVLSEKHQVTALKRRATETLGSVTICLADVSNADSLKNTLPALGKIDYLIYCLSPSERSEQGYRETYVTGLKHVLSAIPAENLPTHILFISSTSVYHQAQGECVTEHSACEPINFSGKVLLEAERYLEHLAIPSSCIRFSGIYGGSRSRLIDHVKQSLVSGDALSALPGFTNRIHEDDCVGFVCHLIGLLTQEQSLAPCYIASDSCPVEQADVYAYIEQTLRCSEDVSRSEGITIHVSEEGLSKRRAGSKRCQNHLMLSTGYALKFASYKDGYKQHT